MSNLTESVGVAVTEDMKDRMEERIENGDYGSKSEYIRSMVLAGESVVAELDPRVGGNNSSSQDIDSAEAAAKALDDKWLINRLSEDEQAFDEITEPPAQEFETVLVNRLLELANDEQSPVETDGQGNYYLEK